MCVCVQLMCRVRGQLVSLGFLSSLCESWDDTRVVSLYNKQSDTLTHPACSSSSCKDIKDEWAGEKVIVDTQEAENSYWIRTQSHNLIVP